MRARPRGAAARWLSKGLAALLCGGALGTAPAAAQDLALTDPRLDWNTVETAHFRVHYPVQAEAWSLHMAAQLDEVRRRVSEVVGYAPTDAQRIDVVVMDPIGSPNGFALPFMASPKMGVFLTAPGAASGIGNYRSWAEDLTLHEDVHLVHLLRPSRSPLYRATVGLISGMGPIAVAAPGWVVEGYATLVEGTLTGRGRPNADFRSSLIRALALEGSLPSYAQLDGSAAWAAGSYRYYIGSAYLEWLVTREDQALAQGRADREGTAALRDLWARMSAREIRDFDEAFTGVFGEPPDVLYRRFTAEVTHAALEVERLRPADPDTLWMSLDRSTGAPALSPDGTHIALTRRPADGPARLVVWSTGSDQADEAAAEFEEAQAALLAADPEDVEARAPPAWPREPVATRVDLARPAGDPAWLSGQALVFSAWMPGPSGVVVPDLMVWEPDSGAQRRITRGASLHDPAPAPGGDWVVAVQRRHGQSQLVRVDLVDGGITALTHDAVPVLHDDPVVDPDGRRVAYMRHDGAWQLRVRDLETGRDTAVPLPEDVGAARPAWSPDGRSIYMELGRGGFLEVARVHVDGSEPIWLTTTDGAALAPAPTPDGDALFYLSLHGGGLELRRAELAQLEPRGLAAVAGTPPVVRPTPPSPEAHTVDVVGDPPAPRPYGAGPQEFRMLLGGAASRAGGGGELGLRVGDPVGRHELLLWGALGEDASVSGGAAHYEWRGMPLDFGVVAFLLGPEAPWVDARAGAELELRRSWRGPGRTLSAGSGLWVDGPAVSASASVGPRSAAFAHVEGAWRLGRRLWVEPSGAGRGMLGQTNGDRTTLALQGARLGLAVGYDGWSLQAQGHRNRASGEASDRLRLGGLDSSLLPQAWSWTRLTHPALVAGAVVGDEHDRLRVAVGTPAGVSPFVQRDRLWSRCGDPTLCAPNRGSTLAGAELDVALPRVSIAAVPAVELQLGVGLELERAWQGWIDSPWRQLDAYAAWVGVGWSL